MEWVPARSLWAKLLAVYGEAECQAAQHAVLSRISKGLIRVNAGHVVRNGIEIDIVPLDAWAWPINCDWRLGDFKLAKLVPPTTSAVARALRSGSVSELGPVYDLYLLSNVRFHEGDCENLGLVFQGQSNPPPPAPKKRGPKARYDWPAAMAALADYDSMNDVVGPVACGLQPQAILEDWIKDWFAARDQAPSPSLVRSHVSGFVAHRLESQTSKQAY